MVEARDVRSDLLATIVAKRACVQAHLRRHRPRSRRLTTATIVLTALAAAFTVGPGVGGNDFAVSVGEAIGTTGGLVWRAVCLAAAVVSVAAAIVTGLSKSQESTAKLNTAAAVDCELEGLAFLLQFGQLPIEDAVELYRQYISKIDFIEDDMTVVAAPPSAAAGAAPRQEPREERARRPAPAAQRPDRGGLPAVPPPVRRPDRAETVLRETVRQAHPRDTVRRRQPPPG